MSVRAWSAELVLVAAAFCCWPAGAQTAPEDERLDQNTVNVHLLYPDAPGTKFSPIYLDAVKNSAAGQASYSAFDHVSSDTRKEEGFHWGRALAESGMFLAMQHSYLAWRDDRWITLENGVPFNHYWRDYMTSLHTWAHSGWDDGDPFLDNYIGHPIQGAITGYFQVQNDPKGAALEFSNTKPYWISRLKAMAWNAAFSTQWEIGPLGEMTVEKYGTWPAWQQNGKWVNGEGQVDLVITPIGGFGWMVGEDLLDRYVVRRIEGNTRNVLLVNFARCALNPIRGGANIMHWKRPWYRRSRDSRRVYESKHHQPDGVTISEHGGSQRTPATATQ